MNGTGTPDRHCRLGIIACVVLSLVTGGWAAAQVKVTASLEQPTVHVSQATILSVEVTVPDGVVPTPRIPNVDHLAISPRGGYHVKQSLFEVTRTFSYYVISDRPGVYSIAPITVAFGPSLETSSLGMCWMIPSSLALMGAINRSVELDTPPLRMTSSGSSRVEMLAIVMVR